MECYECGVQTSNSTGLCRRCEKECLGMHSEPVDSNKCKGYDCGNYATESGGYCRWCVDELDDYYSSQDD